MLKKRELVKRLSEILKILLKYGFTEFVFRIKKHFHFPISIKINRKTDKVKNESFAVRLRLVLEELGPTFIKFGQILSMRSDILPKNIILELQKLQDQVPPFPFAEVKQFIENQFHKSFSDIFSYFNEIPEAAASIAQVHHARLSNGNEVAVKIRRPGINDKINADLEILFYLAKLSENLFLDLKLINPTRLVKEFAFSIQAELDFYKEGRNIECFYQYFSNDKSFYIPHVYWEYSSDAILTMEFIKGIKVSETEKLKEAGLDLKLIARRGVDFFFRQFFEYGFFHADPHPANIFILPGNVIAPLDFGMIGFINDFWKEKLSHALKAFIQRDAQLFIHILEELDIITEETPQHELTYEIEQLINYYHHITLAQLNLGNLIMELIEIMRKYHLRLPKELVLLGKAITIVESIGRSLDPTIDIASLASPYIKKLMLNEFNPSKLIKLGSDFMADSLQLLKGFPRDLNFILRKLKHDRLKIQFEHQNLEHFIKDIDKSSNRLALSIMLAAFIIGAALISLVDRGPFVLGLPLLSFLGFGLATVVAIILVIGIFRSGRL